MEENLAYILMCFESDGPDDPVRQEFFKLAHLLRETIEDHQHKIRSLNALLAVRQMVVRNTATQERNA